MLKLVQLLIHDTFTIFQKLKSSDPAAAALSIFGRYDGSYAAKEERGSYFPSFSFISWKKYRLITKLRFNRSSSASF